MICITMLAFKMPQPASEKMFKEMIVNRPNHLSSPGANRNITFHEFQMAKPVSWTMEYGNNANEDKNTKVYKVIAKFTLTTENFNTATGQKYQGSVKEYRRPYNFFVDKKGYWVCMALGLTKDMY